MTKLLLLFALFLGNVPVVPGIDRPLLYLPQESFKPRDLAIIVNAADPVSTLIGRYYQQRRKIPSKNLIRIHFPPGSSHLSPVLFKKIKARVDRQTPDQVQAYVLTWTSPFQVGCMSITTAFAVGYHSAFCAKGCGETRLNPYYNSTSRQPYHDYGWRPTMMLAGRNYQEVVHLIDRGIASDATYPEGTGYLIRTPDLARSSRANKFVEIKQHYQGLWPIEVLDTWAIENKKDILFYFTGLATVPGLSTNRFVPGAISDHLTSKGGQLTGSRQMSSLRWLEAGATGSYGSVVEPCNYPEKFPDPALVISNYLRGNTLIEAYWKSVAWPGQGVFIGEPLARPFGGVQH